MHQPEIITLTKYNGAPASYPATLRLGTAAQHADYVALQATVRGEMPDKSLYVPSTADELLQDLTTSLCIGVWVPQAVQSALQAGEALPIEVPCVPEAPDAPETLVAYAVMRCDGASAHNYANYFDLPAAEIPLWANMDTVVVRSAYRGNALQQILMNLALAWRKPTIIGAGCTVSPDNAHSLANAQAVGFSVHSRRTMYGAHDRFLLQKRLTPLPGKYRHFKGGEYRVLSIAKHSETLAPMVVYQALYGEGGTWVRPAELWFEWVERDGYQGPRFVYIAP